MAKDLGYATFFWSLAYVDWNVDAQPSHEEAFSKLTGRIPPGAVVLLHNTSKTNGEILDELLTKWEEMGYTFGKLEELVQEGLTSPAPYPIIEDRKIYWRTTMEKELVVVIDFGGQYNQLVARRVRECNVYCEIYSYKTDLNKIKAMNPKGIILTGGPASCYESGAATCPEDLLH